MYLTRPRLTTGQGKVKSKKASGFFSAQSFVDGFTNNALGVVGFVAEGIKEEVLCAPHSLRPPAQCFVRLFLREQNVVGAFAVTATRNLKNCPAVAGERVPPLLFLPISPRVLPISPRAGQLSGTDGS